MAKGCCASVRHFLPRVPLCLLFDGPVERVSQLAATYRAAVLHRQNVASPFLRDRSFGYGFTKMIAFWESPYDHFLLIDADTIVIGDVRQHADFSAADMIVDLELVPATPDRLRDLYFDPDGIPQVFPRFDWHQYHVFNTGAIFAKKGIFDVDHYRDILEISERNPGLFKRGEQGLLNYLAISYAASSRLRLMQRQIQLFVGYVPRNKIDNLVHFSRTSISLRERQALVLHYAGFRPYTFATDVHTEPMTFFRRQYRRDRFSSLRKLDAPIKIEEYLLKRPRLQAIASRCLR
jgi:hypothetical protein